MSEKQSDQVVETAPVAADAGEIPLARANFFTRITLRWLSPLIRKGWKRPLQAADLWTMDAKRESDVLSTRFLDNLARRQVRAAEWNAQLPKATPGLARRVSWQIRATRALPADFTAYGPVATHRQRRATLEAEWRARSGKKHGSIAWALSDTFPDFWLAAPWKMLSDAGFVCYPLLIKEIIKFTQQVAAHKAKGDHLPGVGKGVGLAFALYGVIFITYTALHQFFWQAMHEGVMMRTALIGAVYKRAFELSAQGRAGQPDGKLMTFLSADITRIDAAAEFFHCAWISPLTLIATIILLCVQIGPSGLIGVLVFLIAIPIGTWNMKLGLRLREQSMEWTERRTKLLSGILSAMGVVKMFTYELPFIARLNEIRKHEVSKLRFLMYTRAVTEAMTLSLPTLAAVFALVMYTSITPKFNPAVIFTALAYFNSLRMPLNMIPRAVSGAADAYTGMKRMQSFFEAPTLRDRIVIDSTMDLAVEARDASFKWSPAESKAESKSADESKGAESKDQVKSPVEEKSVESPESVTADTAFTLNNVNLAIPRGQLVAIIGPVGSGKSSLLQGLLGDMVRTGGTVRFGGRLGYCQQSAWIQNATIRDNILFGRAFDEDRYWQAVRSASLMADLDQLVDGDMTDIGEKGVNISGGQKQRINIARALYFDADIVLMDDPLSAVDPHVGKALFNDAILGLRKAGKTVILVTHGLHFLSQVDYIYCLDAGRISQQGTYPELMAAGGAFQALMHGFGGATARQETDEPKEVDVPEGKAESSEDAEGSVATPTKTAAVALMQDEERITGAVGLKVYLLYFKSGGAFWLIPAFILVAIMTASSTMSAVWLTYWSENKFTRSGAFYQGIYGTLGVITALFTLFTGMVMTALSVQASRTLYHRALKGVFSAPMSFFDTNPLGRLMGIFGKDMDAMDNTIAELLRIGMLIGSMLVGAIVLLAINFPYFVAVVFAVGSGYFLYAWYYRRTARELKRIDSILRSDHYAHFQESLTGMSTIRAYGEVERFVYENGHRVDIQNRAYLLTKGNQIWLEQRLDWLGTMLILAVALMCATTGGRTLNSAIIGMCLTYMTMTGSMLNGVAQISIEIENAMNAVERVMVYSEGGLPEEAAYEGTMIEQWPSSGAIEVDKAVMAYRPGLPAVLKGISFNIASGERVGIVGRTGAGKTSITVALYRLVELVSGKITIDGVDISTLGLHTLRSALAVIPQDPVLFSGTLRYNLDPFDEHPDAVLHEALARTCLPRDRFTLESTIDQGGGNLSVGERSLVSLARAFVKNAPIMLLDEATAAVDLETDARIQDAIRQECNAKSKTLLCIAHRLRTVMGWDKILVLEAGQVAEFASPLELFDRRGIFYTMCVKSNITREEIVRARNIERE